MDIIKFFNEETGVTTEVSGDTYLTWTEYKSGNDSQPIRQDVTRPAYKAGRSWTKCYYEGKCIGKRVIDVVKDEEDYEVHEQCHGDDNVPTCRFCTY